MGKYTMRGVALTDVDTTPAQALGSLYARMNPSNGQMETWIYIRNAEAATSLLAGTLAARENGAQDADCVVCPTSQPSIRIKGVAQHTIAAQSYGWILREGIGLVLADTGNITANTAIVSGNAVAGRADDVAAVTDDAIGYSLGAIAATATGNCYISCRG